MSTVRKRDAAATRERILDAAEALIADRGYHGVSIREIVKQAGVELALVHYYFGPKDALFRAVIDRGAAEHAGDHMAALETLRAESEVAVVSEAAAEVRAAASLPAVRFSRATARAATTASVLYQ